MRKGVPSRRDTLMAERAIPETCKHERRAILEDVDSFAGTTIRLLEPSEDWTFSTNRERLIALMRRVRRSCSRDAVWPLTSPIPRRATDGCLRYCIRSFFRM